MSCWDFGLWLHSSRKKNTKLFQDYLLNASLIFYIKVTQQKFFLYYLCSNAWSRGRLLHRNSIKVLCLLHNILAFFILFLSPDRRVISKRTKHSSRCWWAKYSTGCYLLSLSFFFVTPHSLGQKRITFILYCFSQVSG